MLLLKKQYFNYFKQTIYDTEFKETKNHQINGKKDGSVRREELARVKYPGITISNTNFKMKLGFESFTY